MLKTVTFERFRIFESFKVEGLNRINLFVGKNNCGKTALLEGVEGLLQSAEAGVLVRQAERRGEVISSVPKGQPVEADVAQLFYGRENGAETGIVIQGFGDTSIRVEAKIARQRIAGIGVGSQFGFLTEQVTSKEKQESWVALSEFGGVRIDQLKPNRFFRQGPVTFLRTEDMNLPSLLRLWDAISLKPQEKDIVDALRLLEPDLEKLAPNASNDEHRLLGSSFRIKLRNSDNPLSLGSFGAGLSRMLALGLVVGSRRDGFVLVDEIDAGFHHSAMQGMWRMITSTAAKLNSQVFATTHSSDCWRSLGYLCATDPEIAKQVSVHRLEHGLDHTIQYTPEELAIAAQQDIDIR